MRRTASTVGQQLLDLRYVKTSSHCNVKPPCESHRGVKTPPPCEPRGQWMTHRQRVLYAMLTVGAAWFDSRLDDLAALTRHLAATAHVRTCNISVDCVSCMYAREIYLSIVCLTVATCYNFVRWDFVMDKPLDLKYHYWWAP